jgi:hypothetical protein
MKTIVAWLFISFCPFLTGLLWAYGIGYVLDLEESKIMGIFTIQTILWLFLFVEWFDGSKYQHVL